MGEAATGVAVKRAAAFIGVYVESPVFSLTHTLLS
jgi:hypothetical protein